MLRRKEAGAGQRTIHHVFPYDPRHLGLDVPTWWASQISRWPLAAVAATPSATATRVHVICGPRRARLGMHGLVLEQHRALLSGPRWRLWGDDWARSLGRRLSRLTSDDLVVLHVNDSATARLARYAARRSRSAMVIHGRFSGTYDDEKARIGTIVVLREDAVEALSASGGQPGRVILTTPSVDVARFVPRTPHERITPTIRMGFVGRLHVSKGVLELPRVAEQLEGTVELDLVGTDVEGMAPRLLAHCSTAGVQAHIKGEISSAAVAELMHQWDVLAVPSHHEGCPLVVIEALAAELPVAAVEGVLPRRLEECELVAVAPRHDFPRSIAEALASRVTDRSALRSLVSSHEQSAVWWERIYDALIVPGLRHRYPLRTRLGRVRRLRLSPR